MTDTATHGAPPKKGPDLDTEEGLRQLCEILRFLAVDYDEARLEESLAWSRFQDAKEVSRDVTPGLAEHTDAIAAREVAIRSRRRLADTVARLLVRGHAADCTCRTCTLEARAVEMPLRLPKSILATGRAQPQKKASTRKGVTSAAGKGAAKPTKKGGRHRG